MEWVPGGVKAVTDLEWARDFVKPKASLSALGVFVCLGAFARSFRGFFGDGAFFNGAASGNNERECAPMTVVETAGAVVGRESPASSPECKN